MGTRLSRMFGTSFSKKKRRYFVAVSNTSNKNFIINSRTAIAEAIIGLLLVFFYSRTAIAGAIIGLLLVFFISSSLFLLRPYDVTATSCSFVHAISTELHV